MDNIKQWEYVQEYFKEWTPFYKTKKRTEVYHKKNYLGRWHKTEITVEKCDSLEAVSLFNLDDPLVLIFADDIVPGGCVRAGAGMQEESLFRRSALFKVLTSDLYPILYNEVIYARHVPLVGYGEGVKCSFVACPGIKMPQLTDNNMLKECDAECLRNKLRMVIQVACDNGHEYLVLGALGCGVWGCPPRHVASIMKEVLNEYDGALQKVVIAVTGANFNFFKDLF